MAERDYYEWHVTEDQKINWLPGDKVMLYPEPTHEGPHPDDQWQESEIVDIITVDRHASNPTWVVGFIVRGEDGNERWIAKGAVYALLMEA